MSAQFTPWQKMLAYESQVRKIEKIPRKNKIPETEDGVIYAEANCCQPFLTYFNNGKCNACCKVPYDYNYCYCDGYDQSIHRDDRKHPNHYMHIDVEEEYPCRTVPILSNSNYGHRPPIDTMRPVGRKKEIHTFYRCNGVAYSINENGYQTVNVNPTWSFHHNAAFGYTYSPPKQ